MPEKKVLRMIGADKEKQYKERIKELEQTVKSFKKSLQKEESISNNYIEKLHAAESKVRELERKLSMLQQERKGI